MRIRQTFQNNLLIKKEHASANKYREKQILKMPAISMAKSSKPLSQDHKNWKTNADSACQLTDDYKELSRQRRN